MKKGYEIFEGPGFYKYCQITGVFSFKAQFMMVELTEDGDFMLCGSDESYDLESMLEDGYFITPVEKIHIYKASMYSYHLEMMLEHIKKKFEKEQKIEGKMKKGDIVNIY